MRRSSAGTLAFALICASAAAPAAAAQAGPSAPPAAATIAPSPAERRLLVTHPRPRMPARLVRTNVANAIPDPGFESGGFTVWQQCGNVNASITAARAHGGRFSQKSGSSAGEPNGDEGVCEAVLIPPAATLSFWVYQYSTEPNASYAYQEAQLFDAAGNTVKQLYQSVNTTNAWAELRYDLAPYAGRTLYLYVGVHGDGYAGAYTIQFVDDVSLTSATAPG